MVWSQHQDTQWCGPNIKTHSGVVPTWCGQDTQWCGPNIKTHSGVVPASRYNGVVPTSRHTMVWSQHQDTWLWLVARRVSLILGTELHVTSRPPPKKKEPLSPNETTNRFSSADVTSRGPYRFSRLLDRMASTGLYLTINNLGQPPPPSNFLASPNEASFSYI